MKITLDEGYQFGLGVFETISLEEGVPLFLSWHLERLNHSLKVLGIGKQVGAGEVEAFLADQEKEKNLSSNHSSDHGLDHGPDHGPDHVPDHALDHIGLKIMVSNENKIFALRENPYTPEVIRKGFVLDYSPVYRNETSPLVMHKTMNYGDCILEKRRTRQLGIDELVFKNSRGELCEGTTTNLFFVREGQLYTPDSVCGLLPGIVRRFLMERFSVKELVIREADVLHMDECFVTNSLMGIMPVTALAQKKFPVGPVTKKCMEIYQQEKKKR